MPLNDVVVGRLVSNPPPDGGPSRLRVAHGTLDDGQSEFTAHVGPELARSVGEGDWVLCRAFGFVDGNPIYEIISIAEPPIAEPPIADAGQSTSLPR